MNKTIQKYAFVGANNSRMLVNPMNYTEAFSVEGYSIKEGNEIEHYITSPVCFFLSTNVILTQNGSIYHLNGMSEEYKNFIK